MKNVTYPLIKRFMVEYPGTVAWRVRAHSSVVDKHLGKDEEVLYAFCGQKNNSFYDFFSTCVIAITSKRIVIAQKRVLFGYYFTSITPEMFNDINVYSGLLFGKVIIDTIKEEVVISNVSKRAIPEIEANITEYVTGPKTS